MFPSLTLLETPPIIFHYHDEAHDIFLCTRGQMNVWADDRARTLNPGDMASVPPVGTSWYFR